MHKRSKQELLSALVDGELLEPQELDQALDWAAQPEGEADWQLYHLIGETLRSPHMDHQMDSIAQIELEPQKVDPPIINADAANDSVFRWKMVAGFASVVASAVIGWHFWSDPSMGSGSNFASASVEQQRTQQAGRVILRDPRLDALLASQPQYATRAGVQMPAEFLRNASLARLQKNNDSE